MYRLIDDTLSQGYFTDPGPHKLIILGDLFDRGQEAVEMQQFILQLLGQHRIIRQEQIPRKSTF